MRTWKRMLLLVPAGAVLSLACLGSAAGQAAAHPSMPFDHLPVVVVHGTGTPAALTSEELQDAQTFAEQTGVPEATAERIAIGQHVWDVTIAELESDESAAFVNAGRSDDGTQRWVTLTERPNGATRALLSSLPFDVSVRYGAPANRAQLNDLADTARAAIGSVPGVTGVEGGIDADTGALDLTYVSTTAKDAAVRAALANVLPDLPIALRLRHLSHTLTNPATPRIEIGTLAR